MAQWPLGLIKTNHGNNAAKAGYPRAPLMPAFGILNQPLPFPNLGYLICEMGLLRCILGSCWEDGRAGVGDAKAVLDREGLKNTVMPMRRRAGMFLKGRVWPNYFPWATGLRLSRGRQIQGPNVH